MFYESEKFNISQILSVVYYAPTYDDKYVYPGCLPTYELMYYQYGDSYITFNGDRIRMQAGDILYLPKGILNADYCVEVAEKFALYNVYFDTNDIMPKTPIHIRNVTNEIGAVYEKLYNKWLEKQDGYYYQSIQYFFRILELLKKHKMKYNTNANFSQLTSAEKYISMHYCEPNFEYNKLHKIANISYSYFNRLFNDKYGMPPVKFVSNLRVKRACELLSNNTFTVTQVAEMCGYENVYYFSAVFTKAMGMPPGKFKNLSIKQSLGK